MLSEERALASQPVGRMAVLVAQGALTGTDFCTVTLIAPDLVLTASHCTGADASQPNGMQMRRARVTFKDVVASVGEELSSIAVTSIVERDTDLDFAILRLERPVEGIAPMRLTRPGSSSSYLDVIHYPLSLPMRITRGCTRSGVPAPQGEVYHTCSTESGSSGSPILAARDYSFVGLHLRGTQTVGAQQYNSGLSFDALLAASPTIRRLAGASGEPPRPPERPVPLQPPSLLPDPPRRPTAAIREFVIYFDWDSSRLSAQGMSVARQAAAYFAGSNGSKLEVIGHTDTVSSASYNIGLSNRMARSVADALVSLGVPGELITVDGQGETQPAIRTEDGFRQPLNRRVVVRVVPPDADRP